MIKLYKADLNSPTKFRNRLKSYVENLKSEILKKYNINFEHEELSELFLAMYRVNDFNVLNKEGNFFILNDYLVWNWINEKLIPSLVIIRLDDPDILKLLIFSLEITYKMFIGGTRATVTQKGFRERRRTFESVLVDQFIGKLGEIFVKNFLEKRFNVIIKLDWDISPLIKNTKRIY